jgi:hypothetical protein
MPRSLMSLLHSGPFHSIFSNVPPFGLFGGTSSLFCPLRLCPAQRVIFLPAAVTSFRGPQFPWVRIFLKTFPLLHATAARRDTLPQAAAIFLRDPQISQVSSFGPPRRPTASFRSLCRFFRPLTGFTTASPSGKNRPVSLRHLPRGKIGRFRRFGTESLKRALCWTQWPFGNWKFSSPSPTGREEGDYILEKHDIWQE